MRIAIAGAGQVGRSIARELLGNEHEVLLIDRDPSAIKVDSVPDAEWLLADACELSSLAEASLEQCDVVVAATGDDKVNLVFSLLAKTEYGVPRTVARVNKPAQRVVVQRGVGRGRLGVDAAHADCARRGGSHGRRPRPADDVPAGPGEPRRVDAAPRLPVVGMRVGDVIWPQDTALVTLLREGRVIVPSQDDPLESGDELLFVTTEDVEGQLEDMLSPHHHPHHERQD